MRFVTICILILAIMFAGNSIYSRTQINKLLEKAISELPDSPVQSYSSIKPVFEYSGLVSLGKVSQAEQTYLKAVERRITRNLNMTAPLPESYIQGAQAIDVLTQLEKQTSLSTIQARTAIAQAAKDSSLRLQREGSLHSWDAMIDFFTALYQNGLLPPNLFEDFNGWIANIKDVPRRPFGLRDTVQSAITFLKSALSQLGLATVPENTMVLPAPNALTDQQLIAADKLLSQGLSELNRFLTLFNEIQLPPELLSLQAVLTYDKAAIKLAHLQDRGPAINQAGSSYLSELTISSSSSEVPTVAEMMGSFVQEDQKEFSQSQQLFASSSTIPDPNRQAYAGLAAWSEAMLATQSGRGDAATARGQADQWLANASGPAITVAQALRDSPRVLLIVQAP